ncbi:PREDICTED: uncharacterized protein LOC109476550 [Branchiostoma belcheri]|uniref:Uncharacterized protein LOC109476550 n=1 Tax=Branchiostoma belcheri TaxID=7741 RepID=A0A6P4ZU20_BRABE|nr:PREDICTED: uncharacterized protein LOC109476550 [Branchiostoma belcheri]
MQSMHPQTGTRESLGAVGMLPLKAVIDKHKLCFFGRLANLPSSTLAKRVFLLRLYSYIIRRARHVNRGFISDVYRVAQEYGLTEYFEKYWLTTEFPSNTVWKRVVKMAVRDKEERNWIASDNGKTRFTRIHGTNTEPHKLWSLARKLPNHQKTLQALVHLSTVPACHSAKPCPACDTLTQDIVGHMISHCVKFNTLRATLADVLTDKLGTGVMAAVHQQSDERFTEVLLGARVVEEDVEPGVWEEYIVTIARLMYPLAILALKHVEWH